MYLNINWNRIVNLIFFNFIDELRACSFNKIDEENCIKVLGVDTSKFHHRLLEINV